MKVYYKKSINKKGTSNNGNKALNYFTLLRTYIGFEDGGIQVDKSHIVVRFHSELSFAKRGVEDMAKEFGCVHARVFEYNGVDKTDEELMEWLLQQNKSVQTGGGKIELSNSTLIYDSETNFTHEDHKNS